jgi:hypothetical protein
MRSIGGAAGKLLDQLFGITNDELTRNLNCHYAMFRSRERRIDVIDTMVQINRTELLRFQTDILDGIHTAKVLLMKTPAGSEEHESTLESLNELRQALVRCETMLEQCNEC